MKIRKITDGMVEITVEKNDGTEGTQLILHQTSDGDLFINAKRPANRMILKNYNENGKKKSIEGEKKYDVLDSRELQIIATDDRKYTWN